MPVEKRDKSRNCRTNPHARYFYETHDATRRESFEEANAYLPPKKIEILLRRARRKCSATSNSDNFERIPCTRVIRKKRRRDFFFALRSRITRKPSKSETIEFLKTLFGGSKGGKQGLVGSLEKKHIRRFHRSKRNIEREIKTNPKITRFVPLRRGVISRNFKLRFRANGLHF